MPSDLEQKRYGREWRKLADEIRAVHGAYHGGPQIDCRDVLCKRFLNYRAALGEGDTG